MKHKWCAISVLAFREQILGYTQKELGEYLGMGEVMVNRLEHGKDPIRIKHLRKLDELALRASRIFDLWQEHNLTFIRESIGITVQQAAKLWNVDEHEIYAVEWGFMRPTMKLAEVAIQSSEDLKVIGNCESDELFYEALTIAGNRHKLAKASGVSVQTIYHCYNHRRNMTLKTIAALRRYVDENKI